MQRKIQPFYARVNYYFDLQNRSMGDSFALLADLPHFYKKK